VLCDGYEFISLAYEGFSKPFESNGRLLVPSRYTIHRAVVPVLHELLKLPKIVSVAEVRGFFALPGFIALWPECHLQVSELKPTSPLAQTARRVRQLSNCQKTANSVTSNTEANEGTVSTLSEKEIPL
jgi:hypothetical protein